MLPGDAPPGRGAPGRGAGGRGIGRSTGCAEEKGLLPTRGVRAAGFGAAGRGPGVGPGLAGASVEAACGCSGAGAGGGSGAGGDLQRHLGGRAQHKPPERVEPADRGVRFQGDVRHPLDVERALVYRGGGRETRRRVAGLPVQRVFIGSCTNGRIEDLRMAADVARGRKVAHGVRALVVPGSGLVKHQAEEEGLDKIFAEAGFEWREPGCSMCLAMNADRLEPGQRCASTSNRNFEGRQGRGGRTHLVSPVMAAAAAITGKLTDIRSFA